MTVRELGHPREQERAAGTGRFATATPGDGGPPGVDAAGPTLGARTWCELLLVACVDGRLVELRGQRRWWVACTGAAHPSDVALGALDRRLGHGTAAAGLVLHSTSWRYEAAERALVLTYLAALPDALADAALRRGFATAPVDAAETARGDRLRPPERIAPAHVLAHALDHLALLVRCDPAIASALHGGWHMALAPRSPRPAGHLPAGRATATDSRRAAEPTASRAGVRGETGCRCQAHAATVGGSPPPAPRPPGAPAR